MRKRRYLAKKYPDITCPPPLQLFSKSTGLCAFPTSYQRPPNALDYSVLLCAWPGQKMAWFGRFLPCFLGLGTKKPRNTGKKCPAKFWQGSCAHFHPPSQKVSALYLLHVDDLLTPWIISYGSSFDSVMEWHFFGPFLTFFVNQKWENVDI